MPKMKVYNDRNVIRLKGFGETKTWVRKNIRNKGGVVDPATYEWKMPNGDRYVVYAVGVRLIPASEVAKRKKVKAVEYTREDDMGVKASVVKGLKLRIVRKPTNGSKTINLRIR